MMLPGSYARNSEFLFSAGDGSDSGSSDDSATVGPKLVWRNSCNSV